MFSLLLSDGFDGVIEKNKGENIFHSRDRGLKEDKKRVRVRVNGQEKRGGVGWGCWRRRRGGSKEEGHREGGVGGGGCINYRVGVGCVKKKENRDGGVFFI